MSRWLYGEPVKVGRRTWRFKDGGAYEFGSGPSTFVILIAADEVFDISAPWWARPILKALGVWTRMLRAAGLHDHGRGEPAYSLWLGDMLFLDALHADGVRDPALTACWWGVRSNNNRPT
jgi:hypothetical protein